MSARLHLGEHLERVKMQEAERKSNRVQNYRRDSTISTSTSVYRGIESSRFKKYTSDMTLIDNELKSLVKNDLYQNVRESMYEIKPELMFKEKEKLMNDYKLFESIAKHNNLSLDNDNDLIEVIELAEKFVNSYILIFHNIVVRYEKKYGDKYDANYLGIVKNKPLVNEVNKLNGLFHIDLMYENFKNKGIKYPQLKEFITEGMMTAETYIIQRQQNLSNYIQNHVSFNRETKKYELSEDLTMTLRIRIARAYPSMLAEIMFTEVVELCEKYTGKVNLINLPYQDRLLGADLIVKGEGEQYRLIRVYEKTESAIQGSKKKRKKLAVVTKNSRKYFYQREDGKEYIDFKFNIMKGVHHTHFTVGNIVIPRLTYVLSLFNQEEHEPKELKRFLKYLNDYRLD